MGGRYGGNIDYKNKTHRKSRGFDKWAKTFRAIDHQVKASLDLNLFAPKQIPANRDGLKPIPATLWPEATARRPATAEEIREAARRGA